MPLANTFLAGQAICGYGVPSSSPWYDFVATFGGWQPWAPTSRGWRSWCPEIVQIDQETRAVIGPLVGQTDGSERTVEYHATSLPDDHLRIVIADAEGRYLPGGVDEAVLAPNTLIGLQATTEVPGLSDTRYLQTYRVLQAVSQGRDRFGRDVVSTSAESWLKGELSRPIGSEVGVSYGFGPEWPWGGPNVSQIAVVTPLWLAVVLSCWPYGGVGFEDAFTWRECVLGLLSIVSGGDMYRAPGASHPVPPIPMRASVLEGTRPGASLPQPVYGTPGAGSIGFIEDFVDWLAGGAWPSYGQVIDNLCATFGWRYVYDANGYPLLMNSDLRHVPGWAISCDPVIGGLFPVPWESYARQVQRPAYTRVELWYSWLDGATPANKFYIMAASANSRARRAPHESPLWRTETIVSNTAITLGAGGYFLEGEYAFCERRLREHLRQSDVLTVTVDSACPLPTPGDEIFVNIPEDQCSGWFMFMSANVPLNRTGAQWRLGWMRDY